MATITFLETSVLAGRKLGQSDISFGDGTTLAVFLNALMDEVTLRKGELTGTYRGCTYGDVGTVGSLRTAHIDALAGGSSPSMSVTYGVSFSVYLSSYSLSNGGLSTVGSTPGVIDIGFTLSGLTYG